MLFLIIFFLPTFLCGDFFTISSSGLYALGEDITYTPATTGESIVAINASNVVLDLANHIISQNGLTANTHGISIAASSQNVIIKNGVIKNITGKGIIVNSGCSTIAIDSVLTLSCDSRGIDCLGNPSAINNVVIQNCSCINCCLPSAGDFVMSLSQCSSSMVRNCRINNNGSSIHALTALSMPNCFSVLIDGVVLSQNTGSSCTGIDLISSISCIFSQCIMQLNSATGTNGATIGANLRQNSAGNLFSSCFSLYNSTSSGDCYGFQLTENAQQNVFEQCFAINNKCGDTGSHLGGGFGLNGSFIGGAATVKDNSFIECISNCNIAQGSSGDSAGWLVNTADRNFLITCIGSYNSGGNQVSGIRFTSASASNLNWQIQDCIFARNHSTNVGNENNFSYGTRIQVGSNNLFNRNIAFTNGGTAPTPANQLNGIPAGSATTPSAPATSNINSVTVSWTNLAMAS